MEAYQRRRNCVYGKKEKEKKNEMWERLLVFMCGRCSWKGYEKMKHEMELCVASNRSEASELLIKLIVSLKSTVEFVSKLYQF
jgi:hypothetical protein